MRKPSRKTLTRKLDRLVGEIVRKRDKETCQWCGKRVSGSNCHVSHVVPRSAGNLLRWDLKNLKVLCFHCHINRWHKNPREAAEWFNGRFPKRAKYLDKHRHKIKRWKTWELEELFDKLSKQVV